MVLTTHRRRRRSWVAGTASLAILFLSAAPAAAHRTPVALALWGSFSGSAAQCQRLIGMTAGRCLDTTWAARRDCLDAQSAGGCDTAATSAVIAAAHARAINLLDQRCAADDDQTLYFFLNLDLDNDIDTGCTAAEVALGSAVYAPAQRQAARGVLDPAVLACTHSTARAATKLIRFAYTLERRTLDLIAVRTLGPSEKLLLIGRVLARVAAARTSITQALRVDCPDATFLQVYGRDATAFLTDIALRANCLIGSGYVQNALVCPAPVCGNGIQETGEQCDDGNTVDGDGCRGDCTLEPSK